MSVEDSSRESSYEQILPLLTARLDNCGNISLTYKDKWKSQIEMKLACIEDFDAEGKSLGKVDLLEQHGKFNLTSPAAAKKAEEGMLLRYNGDNLQKNVDYDANVPSRSFDPEGTQMPTLATEVSTGHQQRTQIELESFFFNSSEMVKRHDDLGYVIADDRDFKINLKLKRHGKQELPGDNKTEQDCGYDNDEVHSVDVQLMIETDTALSYTGDHFYQVVGTQNSFYVPNYFYAFDQESKKMKMQTMEEGFPKLSELSDDSGSQYFTFRFTNSIEEIFYDLMMGGGIHAVVPQAAWGGLESQSEELNEDPDFSDQKKSIRKFTSKELKGTTNLATWLQTALPLGFNQLIVLTDLQIGFKNVNDDTGVNFAKRDGDSLIAVKSEKTVKTKKLNFFQSLLRLDTSEINFRIEVIYIVAANDAAHRELKALHLNMPKIWRYYHRKFLVDE
jgi:hypothetical protein